MQVTPLEELVLSGFAKRFHQQFGCDFVYTTSDDGIRILQQRKEGHDLTWPFASGRISTFTRSPDRYTNHMLVRRGVILDISNDGTKAVTMRVLPTDFNVEITYETNKYAMAEQGSVLSFVRRWLFTGRNGSLHFKVKYGRTHFNVSATLDTAVTADPRPATTESASAYKIVVNAVLHGYVSEPITSTQGVITHMEVATQVGKGTKPEFWAFPVRDAPPA